MLRQLDGGGGVMAEGRFANLFWPCSQFSRQIVQLSTVAKAPQAA